jgi:Tol biopolymer transport system component
MQLWAVDVSANQSQPLTDPTSLSFSISNGDWELSPDGQHIIFVNSADQNIWLITLP